MEDRSDHRERRARASRRRRKHNCPVSQHQISRGILRTGTTCFRGSVTLQQVAEWSWEKVSRSIRRREVKRTEVHDLKGKKSLKVSCVK